MLRGVRGFNELERSVPGISRSVLAQRLRRLERAGALTRETDPDGRSTGYQLTESGFELGSVVQALSEWGARWLVPHPRPGKVDPDGLMQWIQRRVVLNALPNRRVVIGFELRRSRTRKHYWLVLQPGEVSLCPDHPGFPEDVQVTAEVAALYGLFLGITRLTDAIDDGGIRVDGPPSLIRAFPRWFRIR